MISVANTGGITAPFLFPGTHSPMYSMGNWTIFAFLIVTALTTMYTWYVFGSHSGYRTGFKDDSGKLEVLDAGEEDQNEVMNKALGIGKKAETEV
jgi:hypothetical protein